VFFSIFLIGIVALYGWLNSKIEPVVVTPDANTGFVGKYAINNRFSKANYVAQGISHGPEAIVVDSQGLLHTGSEDGRLFKINAISGEYIPYANTGGRPLGMKFDKKANMLIADAVKGLISLSPSGVITTLVGPEELTFADDLDIAQDGTIWLSDASRIYGYGDTILTFIEGIPSGRLLSYTPSTGELRTHINDLLFANGVALGPDDEYVLVNETGTARIHRLWLKGDKKGERDLFASELPASVDNITFNGIDTFWVALPKPRFDKFARATIFRKILGGLPAKLWLPEERFGFVLGFDLDGNVTHNVQFDPSKGAVEFSDVTSVVEHDGKLFIGSLVESKIAIYHLD
jgi:sugar lactone lactonase YvrE